LDRGWCEWLAEKYPESFDDFKSAAEKLPPSEDLAVARFKMGDALFAKKDFAGALANYRMVLDDFAEYHAVVQTLGDRALYQILRADLELGDVAGAGNVLAQISKNDSTGEMAQTGGLLLGESLLDLRSPAGARAQFEKIEGQFPGSPLRPQVELAIAHTYESAQEWAVAIEKYEGWLKNFPTNSLQPQADYALAWANFQAGDETNAFVQFTNFVARFPTNNLAPQAQWWVADSFYSAGDFVNAEKNYKYIFQNTNWQSSPLIYPAQMMAGRAAVGRLGYFDAVGYFTSLVDDTNCPADLRVQARFAWGGALMQMPSADTNSPLANFSAATNVFGQIVQMYPTNELGALAWSELANCNLQLTNYDAATNAFAQVFNSTNTDISTRSEAQIGFGIVLEKKAELATSSEQTNLFQLALNKYLDVFDTNTGKNLRDGEQADPFWVNKAGLQAVNLFGTLNERSLSLPDLNISTVTNLCQQLEGFLPSAKDLIEKNKAAVLAHLLR
jgi:TolA-binding protein